MSSPEPETTTAEGSATAKFKLTIQDFVYKADADQSTKQLVDRVPYAIPVTRSATQLALQPHNAPISQQSAKARPKSSPLKRASHSSSNSPVKLKRKRSSGYAPPSRYDHLPNLLTDSLVPNLICVFIGVNPGLTTASTGHAYAHPSNLFWKLLHSSGCTPRRCLPSETYALPQLYGLGNTNIVARATANASELSKEETDAGVAALETKARTFRPECIAIVGKGIWESIWRVRHGKQIRKDEFKYGWQDEAENMGQDHDDSTGWKGVPVFVATSTSGLAAGLSRVEKEAIWRQLGERIERRREEMGFVGDRQLVDGIVVSRP